MRITMIVAAILLVSSFSSRPLHAQDDGQKAILVTGATSGIGRNIAESLAAAGHFVYAGARKQTDIDELNAIDNISAVKLDVTRQDEIDAAVQTIRKAGRGLYGLVNNAGVAVLGPMIELSEEDMQFQMDVNLFGPYRVTRAFAPLLIERKGRITTIGSISGILSGPMFGAYSMSKHGVEAYTDSLAAEMQKFGVEVSVIEPGNFNSSIVETMRRRQAQNNHSFAGSRYEEEQNAMLEWPSDRSMYKEPDEVTAAVVHFLFDDHPKKRYLVVPEAREAEITIRRMLTETVQMNEDQPFSYTRDELVKMLDEALEPAQE